MDTPKRRKRPRDPMQLAKLIGEIATGQIKDEEPQLPPTPDELRRVMSALGKKGGPIGGIARAESLSKRRRKEIAQAAAAARWKHKRPKPKSR